MHGKILQAHGLAHVTLTVSNIQRTKKFYEELFQTILEMDDEHSFSLTKVGIPCWYVQWQEASDDVFNEKRIGLDHIAFKLETLEELTEIVNRLQVIGAVTKGLQRFANKYPYVEFKDPDNIQTEFFIPKEL